jgi:hypothetical protein
MKLKIRLSQINKPNKAKNLAEAKELAKKKSVYNTYRGVAQKVTEFSTQIVALDEDLLDYASDKPGQVILVNGDLLTGAKWFRDRSTGLPDFEGGTFQKANAEVHFRPSESGRRGGKKKGNEVESLFVETDAGKKDQLTTYEFKKEGRKSVWSVHEKHETTTYELSRGVLTVTSENLPKLPHEGPW